MNNEIKVINRKKILNKTLEFASKYPYIVLEHATGTGKSFQALTVMSKEKAPCLIVHWEITHKNNWIEEIKKHKFDLNKFEFITYASIDNIKGNYNVIFDEAHHITARVLNSIGKNIKHRRILFLSANLPINKVKLLMSDNFTKFSYKNGIPYFYKLSLAKVVDMGILPKPKIVIHFLQLDNEVQYKINLGKKKSMLITDLQYYNELTNHINNIVNLPVGEKSPYDIQNLKRLGSKRKALIAKSKSDYVKTLLESIDGRCICFTGSKEQCEFLADENNFIHSDLTKTKVTKVVADFAEKSIDSLFSVKMVRESINFIDVKYGVIVQLDNQFESFLQMLGRVIRHDEPIAHVIVVKNTVDETSYLKKCLKRIPYDWYEEAEN